MEYKVIDSNNSYTVEAGEERQEDCAKLIKAMEVFYDLQQRYNAIKQEYDNAKQLMEKAFKVGHDEFKLKKIKGQYIGVTFVEGTPGMLKKTMVMNENKVKQLLNEFGISEDQYMEEEEKITGSRKDSIRVTTE